MANQNQGFTSTVLKLRFMFHEYYKSNPDSIDVPDKVHSREFGIQSWEFNWYCPKRRGRDESGPDTTTGCGQSGKSFSNLKECPKCGSSDIQTTTWKRHVGYLNRDELVQDLTAVAPHSVYHSAAFYKIPVARHMDEKEWFGAELVFDIDADHLELPCAKDHDAWRCKAEGCHKTGTGTHPENCPDCGGTSFSTRKWVCEKCLAEAKKHTVKLYDEFIVNDFGLDPESIQLNYSGHRGYHVRVRDPRVYSLDSSGRIQIVHYIMGLGLNTEKIIVTQRGVDQVPDRIFPGWAGKMADAIIEFVRNIDLYTGTERWVKPLRKGKIAALDGLLRNPPILNKEAKDIGLKSWQEIAEKAAEFYGGEIDRPVTHDIHRVIRLIGSLNGKTGFLVNELTRNELDDFDPFRDAIVFDDGQMKVKFLYKSPGVPKFRIGDETYGPYHGESVELPTAAAAFVLCKGVAIIE
ncbi:MAG: DNA primase small subunit domain-containing protein [Candidatus Thorarchaeota archaeon]|jgi:DNA primase small subunit